MSVGRGGKRPGAGRPVGSKSAVTVAQAKTLSEMAREFTQPALNCLAEVMMNPKAPAAARIAAANSLLDRGHGKAIQTVENVNTEDAAPIRLAIEVREAVGNVRVTEPKRPTSDIPEGA